MHFFQFLYVILFKLEKSQNSDNFTRMCRMTAAFFLYFIGSTGSRVELKCSAYLGPTEDDETLMYWTVNSNLANYYKELTESKPNM